MKNNKMVLVLTLIFILCFVSGCSSNTVGENNDIETLVEIKNVEGTVADITDNFKEVSELDVSGEEIKNVEVQSNSDYTSVSTLCTFLEDRTKLSVDLEYSEKNYYDDYEGITMDEVGSILIKDENNFPIVSVYISFIEGKVHNLSLTFNILESDKLTEYNSLLQDIFRSYLIQNGVSIDGQKKYVSSLLDFDSYELNVYDNLELNILIEDCYGLGVVFEGGKDFEFEGISYYYSIDYPI